MLIMGNPASRYEALSAKDPSALFQPSVDWEWLVNSFEQLCLDSTRHFPNTPLELNVVMIHALLALLNSRLNILKATCDDVNDQYFRIYHFLPLGKISGVQVMEKLRFATRRQVHLFEQSMREFSRYLRAENITTFRKYKAFLDTEEEANACLQEGSCT